MSIHNVAETHELDNLAVNTIRILCVEAIQKANSGHPGMPLGMADVGYILWTKFLKFNPDDPNWINRDRFVLSAGHGSMLLYSLLYLSGYNVTLDDIRAFRQLNSKTPGHPEVGCLPGVEVTTGPLGQGFANGVGMAIASKMMATRFNVDDYKLFGEHFVYGIVSDGDLMEGVAAEAASYSGFLGLGNIIYIYDDNKITIEGKTNLTYSDKVEQRFESYGWHTITIDGHNHKEIEDAIKQAQREKEKPSLIIAKTTIGFGSPNKANTAGVHGSPLGMEELAKTKENLGWKYEEDFFIPEEVKEIFLRRNAKLKDEYKNWVYDFKKWEQENPKLAYEYESYINKNLPDNLESLLYSEELKKESATRSHSGQIIQKIGEYIPYFVGGSADLAPSTNTIMKNFESIVKENFSGRNFHFGIREHGMGAILNGMALYGAFIPYGATFLVFSDYMRPAIRLAALSKLQVIYVFTHDSIFLGEDGPTHQPVEQTASLNLIPNLTLIRPADGSEMLAAWLFALRKKDGPTALILSRQKISSVERNTEFNTGLMFKGAYIAYKEKSDKSEIVIASNGSELTVAVKAAKILEDEFSVRVVSVPSLTLLHKQSINYINELFPDDSKVVVIEAAKTSGWGDILRQDLLLIDLNDFGKSAPWQHLAEFYGFTPEKIAAKIEEWLKK